MRRSPLRGKAFGRNFVTSTHLDCPRRNFKLEDISRVDLKRTLFLMLLPLLLGIVSLVYSNSELIYGHEIFWTVLAVIGLGGGSFFIGVIHITGFNLNGGIATMGLYKTMNDLKDELAGNPRVGSSSRRRGRGQ